MATINQISKKKIKIKKKNYSATPFLKNKPFVKGICALVRITSPKKPNSAERKIARIRLKNGKMLTASIPGQGHNLQKYSVVLVRGGRANDVPACRYKLVRGKYDFSVNESFMRKKSHSKWGLKKFKKKNK
jgi:small subunit ribosomal protein S12